MEIFQSITRLGCIPDIKSYNTIIWSAGNSARQQEAEYLFNELSNHKKLRPNIYSYGALMHGFAKSKSYKRALFHLDDMTRRGIQPNQVVVSSAMEACAAAGQYKAALEIMQNMSRTGVQPDITMLNTAIKACTHAGAMGEAENVAA